MLGISLMASYLMFSKKGWKPTLMFGGLLVLLGLVILLMTRIIVNKPIILGLVTIALIFLTLKFAGMVGAREVQVDTAKAAIITVIGIVIYLVISWLMFGKIEYTGLW